jgi:hypothetical protein
MRNYLRISKTIFRGVLALSLVGALCLAFTRICFSQTVNVSIDIELEKETFNVGEPISGKVIIDSDLPTTNPDTFIIKLYKDDVLFRQSTTNTPIFLGRTEYEFKNFGITEINNGPADKGNWRIVVTKQGDPAVSADVELSIDSADED